MAGALKGNRITGRVFQAQKVAIRAPEIYMWCVVAGNLKLTNVWSYGYRKAESCTTVGPTQTRQKKKETTTTLIRINRIN
jgi:hypothetical protein